MKLLFKAIGGLAVLLAVLIALVWKNYITLETEVFVTERPVAKITNRPINIGVIGESWAAGNKIDNFLSEALTQKGLKSTIVSTGHPGAKSKFVYQNLFKDEGAPHSSNHILNGPSLDYCIVLTGVNDTATHVGANYYAHHIELIVKALITRGITPIVVEIPEYGIEETDSKTIQGKVRRRLMRLVHDKNVVDVIPKYRQVAKDKLAPYIKDEHIIYFPFDLVTNNYLDDKDLYKDNFLYLNAKGNKKLGYALADTIADKWKNQVHLQVTRTLKPFPPTNIESTN